MQARANEQGCRDRNTCIAGQRDNRRPRKRTEEEEEKNRRAKEQKQMENRRTETTEGQKN